MQGHPLRFSPQDLRWLTGIGRQATLVLEAIHCAEQERPAASDLRALHRQVVSAREIERRRTARELHMVTALPVALSRDDLWLKATLAWPVCANVRRRSAPTRIAWSYALSCRDWNATGQFPVMPIVSNWGDHQRGLALVHVCAGPFRLANPHPKVYNEHMSNKPRHPETTTGWPPSRSPLARDGAFSQHSYLDNVEMPTRTPVKRDENANRFTGKAG
jgi:hypothetical protein